MLQALYFGSLPCDYLNQINIWEGITMGVILQINKRSSSFYIMFAICPCSQTLYFCRESFHSLFLVVLLINLMAWGRPLKETTPLWLINNAIRPLVHYLHNYLTDVPFYLQSSTPSPMGQKPLHLLAGFFSANICSRWSIGCRVCSLL